MTTKQQSEIVIDPEFESLIFPLQQEEKEQLESNLVAEGCRDPLVLWAGHGIILDGHNRYEICTRLGIKFKTFEKEFADRSEAKLWMIHNQLGRRNLQPIDRIELVRQGEHIIAAKALENQGTRTDLSVNLRKGEPVHTSVEAAKIAVVSERIYDKGKAILAGRDKALIAAVREGFLSISAAAEVLKLDKADRKKVIDAAKQGIKQTAAAIKKIRREKREAEREEKKQVALVMHPAGGEILTGDMGLLYEKLEDDSVDLFFTDPPYHDEHTALFGRLGELAQAKLKPGGLLLCYSGQMFIPRVLVELVAHLDYWWLFALKHSGGHIQIWNRKLWNDWKPVLVFAKRPIPSSPVDRDEWVQDFVQGGGTDKKFHDWGQDAREATYWIEKLTPVGGLVVDPFCGGGAIPAACKATGRRWLATELDAANAATSRSRVAV